MAAITSAVVVAGAAVYSANKQAKSAKNANRLAQSAQEVQNEILYRQQDIADEQWANYKTNYLPLEQEYLETAKGFGSIANQEKAATNAAASTAAAFSGARDQLNKTPGLDPNSQQYLRTVANLGIKEAATSAAAQTGARQDVEKTGAAMLQDAASLGKGVAGSAVASLNAASGPAPNIASGLTAAANAANSRAGSAAQGAGQVIGGLYKSGAFDAIAGLFSPSVQPNTVNGSAINSTVPATTAFA